jgi:hypothetical protein
LVLFEQQAVLAQNARLIFSPIPFGFYIAPNGNQLNYKAVLQRGRSAMNPLNRTKTIGIKVSESAFEALRKVAEGQSKPLGEWCRDTLMKAALPPPPQPSELAMVAEITATQAVSTAKRKAVHRVAEVPLNA